MTDGEIFTCNTTTKIVRPEVSTRTDAMIELTFEKRGIGIAIVISETISIISENFTGDGMTIGLKRRSNQTAKTIDGMDIHCRNAQGRRGRGGC